MTKKPYIAPQSDITTIAGAHIICASGDTADVEIGSNTGSSGSGDFDSSDKIRPWNGLMGREQWQ